MKFIIVLLATSILFLSGCTKKLATTTTTTITIIEERKDALEPPTFSPVAGTFKTEQAVFLTSTTEGVKIRYTTDGSDPTNTSLQYRGVPIKVSSNTVIKAIASKDGAENSTVATSEYIIEKEIKGVKDVAGKKYFIRRGDNLWNICKKEYGDPWYYPALYEANPKLKSPRKILAGTYLTIPNKSDLKRWDFSK